MKQRIEEKRKAIELRKQGLSYKDIMKDVSVSKSTLSGWLKYLNLSPIEEQKLRDKISNNEDSGRLKSSFTNREKRIARENIVYKDTLTLYSKYKHDLKFLAGIGLYWAEGSKRTFEFQFINSDPEMILFMVLWLENYFNCPKNLIKYRLFIHTNYAHENLEEFWANLIGINRDLFSKTIYKPTSLGIKKNPDYKGCLRISLSGIDSLRKVKYLIGEYKKELMHP